MKKSLMAAMLLAAFGLAQAQTPPAVVPPNFTLQGQPASMAGSKLAPIPGKLTVTPASDIPVGKLDVPEGFAVELWASGMPGVREMVRGDKGKIYIGTRFIGRVYEVTDEGDKRTHRIVVDKLAQPSGVAFKDGSLYVAAIEKVFRFDGIESNPSVAAVDMTKAFNLPLLPHHNWKYMTFGPDGKLYIPIGAPCNICEPPAEGAQIRRYNRDGSGMEVLARGVRNSLGFDWHPKTGEMWFVDQGRDWMGDTGPQEELNRMTKTGLFYGFPYCHNNNIPDQDVKKDKPCEGVTKPVALLGPHASVLGTKFYTGSMFPAEYKDTLFIARRGSWNRNTKSGYDVINVTLGKDGKSAKVKPFLTGFMDAKANTFWGRPTYVLQMPDGSMLVSDEQNGAIYRISYFGGKK